ncbi:MAG: hypothetical protein JWM76_5157, partial [Pseudonocardiales bacterium]|nr:hypothetical protein [Pseudonocardiales bacterium]
TLTGGLANVTRHSVGDSSVSRTWVGVKVSMKDMVEPYQLTLICLV